MHVVDDTEGSTGGDRALDRGEHDSLHVVIAEEDADLAFELQDVARLEGHIPHLASDLDAVVRSVVELSAELLLVDLDARSMNGLDVVRRARARRGSALRIVAMTGNRGIGAAPFAAGADEIMMKPFGRAALQHEFGTTLALGTLRG
jgi:DNA-binding response OmpR family regulator